MASDASSEIDAASDKIAALEALRDDMQTADSVGETRLSAFFHKVRTSSNKTKRVTAFYNVEDRRVVVDHVSKLSAGTWSPQTRDAFDGLLSMSVQPFMSAADFFERIDEELSQEILHCKRRRTRLEAQQARQEQRADSRLQ